MFVDPVVKESLSISFFAGNAVISWLVMAASPMVAEEFSYTYTLSGNDREAIFTDVVSTNIKRNITSKLAKGNSLLKIFLKNPS